MLFEQNLNEIAMQYYFVKNPAEFIELSFYNELPDLEEINAIFKSTKIYHALSLNIEDDFDTYNKKKSFEKSFIDILNAAGLAIESIILSDLDLIIQKSTTGNVYKNTYFYLLHQGYSEKVDNIMHANENIIDFLSFSISNNKLDRKYLESLRNIKNYFYKIIKDNQKILQYLKHDLSSIKSFNYSVVKNWILPYYDKVAAIAEEDICEKVDEQVKEKLKPKTKEQKATKTKNSNTKKVPKETRKIIAIEDALKKNFEGLVGLKDVKEIILRKTKLIQKVPGKAVDCNFRIVGNPGVGKTTIAEAMSKTFYDCGIIKNPEFVELNGAGLKGKYVGHTVGQVKDIFKKAKGGTLFLDEVYSLISPDGSEDSFTQEAITQLMIEVENLYKEQQKDPSNKTLVIMAGYKDKLDMLLDKNIGFKRRFSNIIDIKDYTLEELEEIFNLMMKKDGFSLDEEARKKLLEILEQNRKKKNFSNAGYVRVLLQKAEEYQAGRTDVGNLTISEEDLAASSKELDDSPEQRRIGFQ